MYTISLRPIAVIAVRFVIGCLLIVLAVAAWVVIYIVAAPLLFTRYLLTRSKKNYAG